MRSTPVLLLLVFAAATAAGTAAVAQQRGGPRVGYVYPAGGKQGSTFEAVVAGQFLTGLDKVLVSGGGVSAKLTGYLRPMTGKETNDLRIEIDELLARKAVVQNDVKLVERLGTFKNPKNVKENAKEPPRTPEQELEELKKKYPGATWTAKDDEQLAALQRKLNEGNRRPANPAISELAVVQVTIADDAGPGMREVRIATPQAISNPLVFCVGQLPEFSEKISKEITQQQGPATRRKPATKEAKPEPEPRIDLPVVVNGQILPGEAARYRFRAVKGQRLVAVAAARRLIPYIADAVPGWFQATLALYDATGKEVAYNDDFRFDPDPVLCYEVPRDGEYTLEIKDAIYRGREDFVFRITIGELPYITGIFPLGGPAGSQTEVELTGWNLPVTRLKQDARDKAAGVCPLSVRSGEFLSNAVPFAVDDLPECLEKEPNDGWGNAQAIELPVIVNGRIGRADDVDLFALEGHRGDRIVATVYARRLGSPLDSLLKLTDAAGHQLAINDDDEEKASGLLTHHADSRLEATLPADGRYFVRISDAQHRGGPEYAYRLCISPPRPDFALRMVPSSLSLRAGGSAPVTVYALRRDGFSGEIAIALKNAPAGFKLSGNRVPEKADQVRLTLTAPDQPSKEPIALRLEGRAKIEGREVVRDVVPAEDMMQAFFYRHLVPADELLVAVGERERLKAPLKLLSEEPLRIPLGGTVALRFAQVGGTLGERIELELDVPPPGISVKSLSRDKETLTLLIQADGAKLKAGQSGNLIVNAFVNRKVPASNGKAKATTRKVPLGSAPAVRFTVERQEKSESR